MRLGKRTPHLRAGILSRCASYYLESPLTCVAGVSGSNLKQRIEDIMTNRRALELSIARRAALALAGTHRGRPAARRGYRDRAAAARL
jgi:hypothetical protein